MNEYERLRGQLRERVQGPAGSLVPRPTSEILYGLLTALARDLGRTGEPADEQDAANARMLSEIHAITAGGRVVVNGRPGTLAAMYGNLPIVRFDDAPDTPIAVPPEDVRPVLTPTDPPSAPDAPVLPPGCRLSVTPEGWVFVLGRHGALPLPITSDQGEAVRNAWKAFVAFMSREDYEGMAREAGRALVDRRKAERFDGLSWQDMSGHLDRIAAALGITGVWHLRDVVAACEALANVYLAYDGAQAALRRAGIDGTDLAERIDALAEERDERARDLAASVNDARAEVARLRAKWRETIGERDEARAERDKAWATAKRAAAMLPPIKIIRSSEPGVRERVEFPDGSVCVERETPNTLSWEVSPPYPAESLASEWSHERRRRWDQTLAAVTQPRDRAPAMLLGPEDPDHD